MQILTEKLLLQFRVLFILQDEWPHHYMQYAADDLWCASINQVKIFKASSLPLDNLYQGIIPFFHILYWLCLWKFHINKVIFTTKAKM